MAHKSIRLVHNETPYNSKKEGIIELTKWVNENIDNYQDGELFALKYYDKGKVISTYVIINIDSDNVATLTCSLNERDTLKVQEHTEEPEDTDVIWLHKSEEDASESFSANIKALRKEIDLLKQYVMMHEYAFAYEMNAGPVSAVTNSVRKDLMANYPGEAPDGYGYLYILMDEESAKNLIASGTTFIEVLSLPVMTVKDSPEYVIYEGNYYQLKKQLEIEPEIKPDYPLYNVPNVAHIMIKSANTEQEIKDNILNLCENELIWCIETNSLYIRSVSSKGMPKIVKISGNGGSLTGVTVTGYTYVELDQSEANTLIASGATFVEKTTLPNDINSDSDEFVKINDRYYQLAKLKGGYKYKELNADDVEEILSSGAMFKEKSEVPSPITEISEEYVKVGDKYYQLVEDKEEEIEDEIYVDENGILVINSERVTVDKDGILNINIPSVTVENNILKLK